MCVLQHFFVFHSNLKNINEVLSMMKSLKIEYSIDTCTAIIRALAWNKQVDTILDEMRKAEKCGLQWTEQHIMEIVKTLASMSLYQLIPDVCIRLLNIVNFAANILLFNITLSSYKIIHV